MKSKAVTMLQRQHPLKSLSRVSFHKHFVENQSLQGL